MYKHVKGIIDIMSGRRSAEPSTTQFKKIPERKKIYVIFEGERTEPTYFEHYSKTIGRNYYFEINLIPKIDIDQHQTNRVDMIDIAKGYMTYITTGKCDPYYFVTLILNDYYRFQNKTIHIDENSRKKENNLLTLFSKIRIKAIKELKIKNLIKDGLVTDYKAGLDEVIKMLSNTKEMSVNEYSFQNFDMFYPELKTYNPPYDRVYIVFDRDYSRNEPKHRTKEEYIGYIDKCEKYGYDALVSTPMFEFWLLIHHHDIDYLNYSHDLFFKKQVIDDLVKYEGSSSKTISRSRFEKYYLNNFDYAVEASHDILLTTDLQKLENNIGSNVGDKLKSLQNYDNDYN